ncbi:MAG: hypothetical protein IPH76_10635 [Xanthomonadales bacterium]|nr:hypothetical protein [Xanthomonadales bacterium]
MPDLGFCDFHGVRLYEWNALRNLIQGNDFNLDKLADVTASVKSMWQQCLRTSIEPLVSEPAEAILNAEFAFQVPRHAWLPFGQTEVRCPAPY